MRCLLVIAMCLALSPRLEAATPNPRAVAAEQAEAGRAAFARGDLEEALRRFQEAFATFPAPSFLLNVAEVQLRMQRTDRAIETLRGVLKLAVADPSQAELAQHVRLRLAELERATPRSPAAPTAAPPVEEPAGPEGVRAAVDARTGSGRRPFVDAIDDSMRPPVVAPIDDAHAVPQPIARPELVAAPQPPPPRHGLKPWEVGVVTLGVVAGLVLTFAPIVYYTAPPLHKDVFQPSFTFGVTR